MIKPACDLQTVKTRKKSTLGFRQITSYLPEGFRQITSYFPEGFRQITSYLPEGLRQITSYLPEEFQQIISYLPKGFRQITSSFFITSFIGWSKHLCFVNIITKLEGVCASYEETFYVIRKVSTCFIGQGSISEDDLTVLIEHLGFMILYDDE